jgi:hypothetical protein
VFASPKLVNNKNKPTTKNIIRIKTLPPYEPLVAPARAPPVPELTLKFSIYNI